MRRGGRDRYRPRELRGVIGTFQRRDLDIVLSAALTRTLRNGGWDGMCHHGVLWTSCERCSTPRRQP